LPVWVAVLVSSVALTTPLVGFTDVPRSGIEDRVSVGFVYVPVVARSSSGPLRDLRRRDFRLLVDGRPTVFETFDTGATAPTSVVVLQDLSGSMANGGKLEASRTAVRYLLDRARLGDEFALAGFAGGVFTVDVPFTADRAALTAGLDAWEAYGTTALHDAIARIPQLTAERGEVKRAAILITDGVDNSSTIGADEASQLVRDAQVPVYVLGLGSGQSTSDAADDEDVQRFADVLERLATMTGGRYYALRGAEELDEACAEMLEELRHQYVLGFRVGGSGSARAHRLEVQVGGRGKRWLTFRQGYYGLDPVMGVEDRSSRRTNSQEVSR
jgi:VWFA-related protein